MEEINSVPKKKRVSKGIVPDIENLRYPEKIKRQAVRIYKQLDTGEHKETRRKKIACYCMYQAHIYFDHEDDINVIELGKSLGLRKTEAKSAVSMKLKYKPGYAPIKPKYSYENVIRKYMMKEWDENQLSGTLVDDLIESFNQLLKDSPALKSKQFNTLIAAFIIHYMKTIGISIDTNKVSEDFGLDSGTVKSMQKEIVGAG